MIKFTRLYKPFDYAIYLTIRMWSSLGAFNAGKGDYFRISGFISTSQIGGLIAFEECLLSLKSVLLKKILFIGGWIA